MIDHRHARSAPAAERGGGAGIQAVPAAFVAEAQAEVGVLARLQIVRRILGHERHRAAEGIGAIERTCRPAHDLDPFERVEVDEVAVGRSEEHTSELQSLMRISYAVFCLKKKKTTYNDPKLALPTRIV